jgi:CheY-like chemotaxis protein
MPGMDGYDFLKTIGGVPDWTGIPVIVLSGRNQPPEETARELGIPHERCFLKPSDPGALAEVVRHVCAESSS